MLTELGNRARAWVAGPSPWTNVYGLARTLIALATAGTLAFSHSTTMFHPVSGISDTPLCDGLRAASLFCVLPAGWLEVARWTAVLLLVVVASGWRPRLTGLVHWWVAVSLHWSATLTDGGDQIAAILALLMLPLTLTDDRRWHWSAPSEAGLNDEPKRLIARSAWVMLRLQVAGIYFHASVGKFKVAEWVDGTALYYWLLDPLIGAPAWLARLMLPVLSSPVVALLTWSVLLLELGLAMGPLLSPSLRRVLLPLGIAFHLGIAVFHGLISFVAIMFGALILLLRPHDETFRFERLHAWLRQPRPQPAPAPAMEPVAAQAVPTTEVT
ncbi:sporulation-delaying protein SdpB family protein [Myxococcus sp. AB036A]|uniref:sporulation-delaying protein SdpB family protein n=1 Tax=Myxococcus sp. AB036A TaxID=2562793 RepID=UPI0011477A51|nr:sporulation-delaying protein SdpB family protein [Myxococcus sp. AB036A]